MKKTNLDYCILISSCDKYSDTWNPFFTLFFKYWPKCPYNIYLITNKKHFSYQGLNIINLKTNYLNWSNGMIETLHKINHKYILYMQDDYFLTNPVDNDLIKELFYLSNKDNLSYLRLFPEPGKRDSQKVDNYFEIIKKGSPFSTALQASIWNREIFINLLKKGESIREFEMNSPKRSKLISGEFLSLLKKPELSLKHYPIEYFCTAIRRGKWRKKALNICIKEGIIIDENIRKKENILDFIKKDLIYNNSPLRLKKIWTYILW